MHLVWGRVTLGERMDIHPSENKKGGDEVIECGSPNICYGPQATEKREKDLKLTDITTAQDCKGIRYGSRL